MAGNSPAHRLLGNFSATLGFSSNCQLVKQRSVHRATCKLLCLDSHSHASATSEAIKIVEYSLFRDDISPIS